MKSVKKYDNFGSEEIISFDDAVNELIEAYKQKTILQLRQGFQMNTTTFHYKGINSVKDLTDNIDDNIDLNEEDQNVY